MDPRVVRILLVDDDEADYLLTHRLLMGSWADRYQLDWVSTYDAAVEAIERGEHDVYVLDYKLPGRSGLDLLREAIGRGCTAPIIILTAHGDHSVDVEAMRAGAADYLDKSQLDGPLLERSLRYAVERKRISDVFRQLLQAVDTMQLGVTITDTRGRILYTNPAEAEMHGYTVEELLGTEARRLSPPDESHPMTLEELKRARKWRRERVRLRKDGSSFPAQLMSDVIADYAGRPLGLVTTCEDITDRVRKATELRRSEERYRALVEAARDVIFTLSKEGLITSLNLAFERITGWGRDEWLGRHFAPLVHPDDLPTAVAAIEQVLKGEKPASTELRLPTQSGAHRVFEYKATPQVCDGEIIGLLGIARDVTEHRQAEQRQATQFVITRLLAQACSVDEAGPKLLQTVCEGLGWDIGFLWEVDPRRRALHCRSLWHSTALVAPAFAADVQTTSFAPGQGLPGRVWSEARPIWTDDLRRGSSLERAFAEGEGLRAACAFPVAFGSEVLGVVELFRREVRVPEDELLWVFGDIGSQVGQFLRRKRAEDALDESEERYALAVRGANEALWDWALKTNEIYFSPRWKSILGYQEHELPNLPDEWLSRIHPEDRERVETSILAHLEGTAPHFEAAYRIRHKDGSYRWVFTHGLAVRDSEGTAYRMAGAQSELADRRADDLTKA